MFRRVANWFCGRHTMFAVFFTLSGTALAFKGLLTMTYVALISGVQGLIYLHSKKEDAMKKDDK